MAGDHRCNDYNQILSAYLDGEVTTAERTELLQHLATCASCRATMDSYRSIGTRLRGMAPIQVPDALTDAIYSQTVDAPPRRLSLFSSRTAYPMAAVAAVLLVFVVAAFLLLDGYERRIDPSIVGSEPVGEVEWWDINDPIKITFNKEMDRESVENALKILPTSERERLDRHWEGNTLIIGGNESLKPNTNYDISFSNQARDKWGNPLGAASFSMNFGTNSRYTAFDDSVAADPTSTPVDPTQTPEAASTPLGNSASATATPDKPEQALTVPTSEATPVTPAQNGGGNGQGEGNSTVTPVPTEEPVDSDPPAPSPTPEPQPTETPRPTATQTPVVEPTAEPTEIPATETPVPEPTATTEPEPTAVPQEPTAEPTAEPTQTEVPQVRVEGSFGNVYWSNEPVRTKLGDPQGPQVDGIDALEMDFQQGKMFYVASNGLIYVLYTEGRWEFRPDTSGADLPAFDEGDEDGLWIPGGVLGYHWKENPDLQDSLGQSLEDKELWFATSVQEFDGGTMLWSSDGFIYVLYEDNLSWELYPDAGPLSEGEPTPVPAQ